MKKLKSRNIVTITENAFINKGEGVIEFPGGLTITDDSEQWNGTRYDMETMDVSEYKGQLTADHEDRIEKVIGKVSGVKKVINKVTLKKIDFAVEESALARLTYDLIINKYVTDFSIETIGPYPDEEGVYRNAKLIGLSVVVVGNNKSAYINDKSYQKIVTNAIKESKEKDLDTSYIEEELVCYNTSKESIVNNLQKNNHMDYVTIKNSRSFSVEVSFKNASGEMTKKTLGTGESLDVSKDQEVAVLAQINSATEKLDIKAAVSEALLPIVSQMKEDMKKELANAKVTEPAFTASKNSSDEAYDYKEAHGKQILFAWNWLKNGSQEDHTKLMDVNKMHLQKLQEKKLVKNTITIADMGNFVISPELLTEIEGFRSDFAPLLSRVSFQDTLSLQMAWLNRSGDISMQEVEMCDDGADGNLKPISEYTATIRTSNLHELAAVTPVCNAATRFLAADLLSDVAEGYRTDYDRKRAQLLIVRLQQAVNDTGNVVPYTKTSDVTALKSFITAWSYMAEEIENGTFIFNYRTWGEIMRDLVGAGINTDTGMGIFTRGEQPMILGRPYIVVPNELMPTLNTVETKSFTVEGTSVTIDKGVFYADLSKFSGRTSGGLQYDLSTEAAYEEGEVVKSAFQRNELVLRGSFFRGGAMRDTRRVVAMGAAGIS